MFFGTPPWGIDSINFLSIERFVVLLFGGTEDLLLASLLSLSCPYACILLASFFKDDPFLKNSFGTSDLALGG